MHRLALPVLAAAALLLALPAGASAAKVDVAVGLGDQSPAMFASPHFRALGLKKARYFIKWDTIRRPGELAQADAFVRAANAAGVRVLLHVSSNDLRRGAPRAPSVARYTRDVGALVRRYRAMGVTEWGAMNEANHDTQPTWRSPATAARYFLALRGLCRGCTIVALDVLDQAGVERYVARFYAALGRKRSLAKVVGIHNYSDTNRFRDRGTRAILRAVRRANPRARFWLTETGGIVGFGRSFPCSPRRAAKATDFLFTLSRRFRRDLERVYAYNWSGTDCSTRFDAGLVDASGEPRPAYHRVRRHLRDFAR
jgi:hypothetical protein